MLYHLELLFADGAAYEYDNLTMERCVAIVMLYQDELVEFFATAEKGVQA